MAIETVPSETTHTIPDKAAAELNHSLFDTLTLLYAVGEMFSGDPRETSDYEGLTSQQSRGVSLVSMARERVAQAIKHLNY